MNSISTATTTQRTTPLAGGVAPQSNECQERQRICEVADKVFTLENFEKFGNAPNPAQALRECFYSELGEKDALLVTADSYNQLVKERLVTDLNPIPLPLPSLTQPSEFLFARIGIAMLFSENYPTKFEWVQRSLWDKIKSIAANIFLLGYWTKWKNQDYLNALANQDFNASAKAIKAGADRLYPLASLQLFKPLADNVADIERSTEKMSFVLAQIKSPSKKTDNPSGFRYDAQLLEKSPLSRTNRAMKQFFADLSKVIPNPASYLYIGNLLHRYYHIIKVDDFAKKMCSQALYEAIRSESSMNAGDHLKFNPKLIISELNNIEPQNAKEEFRIIQIYNYCGGFTDANLPWRCINGMMRFKESQKAEIYLGLASYVGMTYFNKTRYDEKTLENLTQLIQNCFNEMPPKTDLERSAKITALRFIEKQGLTDEQKQWAREELSRL